MKLIQVIIAPEKLDAVKDALAEAEVFRFTISEVLGTGHQRGAAEAGEGKLEIERLPGLAEHQAELAGAHDPDPGHELPVGGRVELTVFDPRGDGLRGDVLDVAAPRLKGFHFLRIDIRVYTMPEVGDMMIRTKLIEHLLCSFFYILERTIKHTGI